MFGLEALRLGPVLGPRVPASAGDGPTELLGLIADEFRLFIVGFVLTSELETLLLWPFGVLGLPTRDNLVTSPDLGNSGSRGKRW
jgi:hypothetical protein